MRSYSFTRVYLKSLVNELPTQGLPGSLKFPLKIFAGKQCCTFRTRQDKLPGRSWEKIWKWTCPRGELPKEHTRNRRQIKDRHTSNYSSLWPAGMQQQPQGCATLESWGPVPLHDFTNPIARVPGIGAESRIIWVATVCCAWCGGTRGRFGIITCWDP